MIKTKVAFLEGRLFPANQSHLKSFQKALIGWLKAGLPIKPLLFDHVNRLNIAIHIRLLFDSHLGTSRSRNQQVFTIL